MKHTILKKILVFTLAITLATITLTGCGQEATNEVASTPPPLASETKSSTDSSSTENTSSDAGATENTSATELYVQFGDDGAPFTMRLYDNETASAIARHVGTADWRIPLYNYEGYENFEVMQYYDIPSRYEIPSSPENVSDEQAGAVYYSEPNRIVLFYGDAEVSGEYTPVGYFDATEEFVSAVQDNPVLEGWGNKIIHISTEQ